MCVVVCISLLLALVPWLAHGSASHVANATTVTTASELNTALANNDIHSIAISKAITVDVRSWVPVTINRSVAISGGTADATLSFAHSTQVLLRVPPAGALKLEALVVRDFLSAAACNGSQAQLPGGPVPAISSSGGSVTWVGVTFYSRADRSALRWVAASCAMLGWMRAPCCSS
jgi:hypothetical protein